MRKMREELDRNPNKDFRGKRAAPTAPVQRPAPQVQRAAPPAQPAGNIWGAPAAAAPASSDWAAFNTPAAPAQPFGGFADFGAAPPQ